MTARSPKLRRGAWLALAVVVVVGLGIGASKSGPPPTAAAKAHAIDSVLKCPVCDGLSVADSSAELAVTIRSQVLRAVRRGESASAIESHYVALYGPQELLRPRNPLVWVVPVVVGALAVAGLGVFFWRRHLRARAGPAPAPGDHDLVQQALAGAEPDHRSLAGRGGAATAVGSGAAPRQEP
jgi:cytochrome c-type biogenesis protein CcmH